jgi:hypothetical protein
MNAEAASTRHMAHAAGLYRKVTTFLFVNPAPAHIIERGSIRDPGSMRNGAREMVPAEMMLQGEKQ